MQQVKLVHDRGRIPLWALLAVMTLLKVGSAQTPAPTQGAELMREFANSDDTDAFLRHTRIRPQLQQLLGAELPHLEINLDVRGSVDVIGGQLAVNGNAGVWTQITVDEELGLAYLPVESPSSDYYGGRRPGHNLFGESLVCVDVRTGQRKWHFQLVHHPIWDHDISSAPILLDTMVDGRMRKLVAQPSKQTFLYVFDRVTGEPIWPIVETSAISIF